MPLMRGLKQALMCLVTIGENEVSVSHDPDSRSQESLSDHFCREVDESLSDVIIISAGKWMFMLFSGLHLVADFVHSFSSSSWCLLI